MFFVGLDIYRTANSEDWPSVSGRIIRFADMSSGDQPRSWKKDRIVEYEYSVSSQKFNGNRISFNRRKKWYPNDVKELTNAWIASDKVAVFYSPKNPKLSVLKPGGSNVANIVFLSAQLVGVCGLMWVFYWSMRRKPKGMEIPANP
jgi:hypothetical protein